MKIVYTLSNTPLFNRADLTSIFPRNGKQLIDEKGHCRALEFIAFPNRPACLIREIGEQIVQVEIENYPNKELYTDRRFLTENLKKIALPELKSANELLNQMRSLLGTPYIWGGNDPKGVKELFSYYPAGKTLSEKEEIAWSFQGLDCSGLLYYLTNGQTPRNTSELVSFGIKVDPDRLQPLDMIVFKGHVVFVLNTNQTIESREGFGVVTCDLKTRIQELLPNNPQFRRWHPDFL